MNDDKPESNKNVITLIVGVLAIAGIICLVGLFTLIGFNRTIPTELWLLTSNIFTAITAMLVKTSPTATTSTDKPSGNIVVPEQKLETQQS